MSASQFGQAFFLQPIGFGAEPVGLLMVKRPHVGFRHGSGRAQDALFAATGAGAVARDQRFVVAPHHQVIAESGFARVLRRGVVVEAEELLRRVREQTGKDLRGGEMRIQVLRLRRHAQGIVVAANLDAFAAAFAEVGDEDGEQIPPAPAVFFSRLRKTAGTFE